MKEGSLRKHKRFTEGPIIPVLTESEVGAKTTMFVGVTPSARRRLAVGGKSMAGWKLATQIV